MSGGPLSRISVAVKKVRYRPGFEVKRSSNLVRIGSEYGGWTFENSEDLLKSTIVSCGLGEDASFDIEFAAKFDAKVVIVDPTPRAIQHFDEIKKRIGLAQEYGYVEGGKQPASSYDLRNLSVGSLVLEPRALWIEDTKLRFFLPANPEHVSHSIVNYQNNYSEKTPFIEVPTITLEDLIAKYDLKYLPLMKLDIEGAEISVVRHMLANSIRPRQLLMEFDQMNFPSARSKANVLATDALLKGAGYECRFFDGRANVLYVLR
jgi:FkbM family methyltransferase